MQYLDVAKVSACKRNIVNYMQSEKTIQSLFTSLRAEFPLNVNMRGGADVRGGAIYMGGAGLPGFHPHVTYVTHVT